jgi:hemoglobin
MAGNPEDTREELFPVRQIEQMVEEFYARVQKDPELGPIFDKRIDDWPVHLGRMVRFWRAVLRSEPGFTPSPRGAPPVLHRRIDELRRDHFQRWLGLFGEVVDEIYAPRARAYVKEAAARIAMALSRHLPPDAEPGAHSPASSEQ